jgi:hypothetical protein
MELTPDQLLNENDPVVQKLTERVPAKSLIEIIIDIAAAPNALTAIPASKTVTTSTRPLLRETHTTTAIATLEVMTAMLVTPIELNGKPIAAPSTAPRAAPAETPTNAGSASGFRKEPWSSTPALPNPTPTPIAATVRGSLMFQITTESALAAPKLSETAMSTNKIRNRANPRIQDLPIFFTAQSVLKMRHAMR